MSKPRRILQSAAFVAERVPLSLSVPVAQRFGAFIGPRVLADRAAMLERHLSRAQANGIDEGSLGSDSRDLASLVSEGLGSYGRYWVETFALPRLDPVAIDRGFSFVGFEKIQALRAAGTGALLVLPHLGGWEWAAAWLGRVADVPVSAVVEPLEPEDVAGWFKDLRESYGVEVIAQGEGAVLDLLRAVRRGDVVCLLSDRDLTRNNKPVPFFGEPTPLPIGPALLARRCKVPLLPAAVFFDGRNRICVIDDPIQHDQGDPIALTAELARRFERLIQRAPAQWHLLEPNWPTDPGYNDNAMS